MRVVVFICAAVLGGCSSPGALPSLTGLFPTQVDEVAGGEVDLYGVHLRPAVTLDFDRPSQSRVDTGFFGWVEGTGGRADLEAVTWRSDTLISAVVPGGLALGRYSVFVVDPKGHQLRLVDALEVVDCVMTACVLPDGGSIDIDAGVEERFDAGWTPCGNLTFEDLDLDGFGRPDSGAFVCGAYRAPADEDCNDRDDLTHPDAGEVCNGLDDDCDGEVDESACPDGGVRWARVLASGPTWETTWSWAPGAVWIAGASEVRVRRGSGNFERVSGGCPGNISTCWAEPSGRAYFSGGNRSIGRVAPHGLTDDRCEPWVQFSEPVTGLIGFPSEDGGAALVGVLRNGRIVRGVGGLTPPEAPANLSRNVRIEDLHGVDSATLFAVGYDSSVYPRRMKAFRLGADGGWVDEHVERLPGLPRGALRAVWVLDAQRVVAVGDQGTVIERTPFGWTLLPRLSDAHDFTGVRAFSLGRVYAVDDQGFVRRWTGHGWQELYDGGVELRDITGTSEEDLWVSGTNGTVVHWPE
jgi:hypothetical protein